MDRNVKDILTSTLDRVYVGIQGLEMPMKPENVRIMANVFNELKAMYDIIVDGKPEGTVESENV